MPVTLCAIFARVMGFPNFWLAYWLEVALISCIINSVNILLVLLSEKTFSLDSYLDEFALFPFP